MWALISLMGDIRENHKPCSVELVFSRVTSFQKLHDNEAMKSETKSVCRIQFGMREMVNGKLHERFKRHIV